MNVTVTFVSFIVLDNAYNEKKVSQALIGKF